MNTKTAIKNLSAFTLAIAFVGSAILAPATAHAGKRTYISYGALNGNRAPCASRSHVNPCLDKYKKTPKPYRRACTENTRCARG